MRHNETPFARLSIGAAMLVALCGCADADWVEIGRGAVESLLHGLCESSQNCDARCPDGSPRRPAGAPCPAPEP